MKIGLPLFLSLLFFVNYVWPENLSNSLDARTKTLKEEFEKEHDPAKRRILAKEILISQLEPGKPEYPDSDDETCVPTEQRQEILAKRLPYVEKEIKRLLQPDNTKYFEQVSINDISTVGFSIKEWGYSKKNPKEKIEFWEKVLAVLPQNVKDSWWEPLWQLVNAHASYGAQLMLTDKQAAKEEIELAESLGKEISMSTELSGILESMKRWIERKPQPGLIDANDLFGEYTSSTGYAAYKLILKKGNKYEFTAQGDVITLCPSQPKLGKFIIQGRYLVLIPGPHISNWGLEAPEVMVPMIWGKHVFLLRDFYGVDGIVEFCNTVNSKRTEALKLLWLWCYHRTGDQEVQLDGTPSLPEEWQDCILDAPIDPEVIKVEDKFILLNMGHSDGLRIGMQLYLKNREEFTERAIWKIIEVNAKESRAIPYGSTPPISVGQKLSTRAPY
jgi:hypothetical protein